MSTESAPKRGRERRAHAAPNARDIAGWARLGITVAGGLLAVASVVVWSISLGRLAADAGYHDLRAVLFALGFDFAAAVTGLAWAGGRPGSYWFHFGIGPWAWLCSPSKLRLLLAVDSNGLAAMRARRVQKDGGPGGGNRRASMTQPTPGSDGS